MRYHLALQLSFPPPRVISYLCFLHPDIDTILHYPPLQLVGQTVWEASLESGREKEEECRMILILQCPTLTRRPARLLPSPWRYPFLMILLGYDNLWQGRFLVFLP